MFCMIVFSRKVYIDVTYEYYLDFLILQYNNEFAKCVSLCVFVMNI